MGGIKGEEQKWDVVSWRWLAVHLKIGCVCGCFYVCVFAHDGKIRRWLTISVYLSLQQRMHPPRFFPSVSAELYMTEALFFSLPSFLCFSAAVVTTSSIVERITDQLELVLYFSKRDRIITKNI